MMIVVLLLLAAIGIWTVSANASIDQKAVLSGKVVSVVAVGTVVREGDTLVKIETITGGVPAARATTDGTVKEVFVSTGDTVHSGQLVVRIQSAR
jgi:biotin carboxyl carrier protein